MKTDSQLYRDLRKSHEEDEAQQIMGEIADRWHDQAVDREADEIEANRDK